MFDRVRSSCQEGWRSVKAEWKSAVESIRNIQFDIAFLLAVLCTFFVIVGNVIILIAYNFWITQFPPDETKYNTKPIAIQVVTMIFLVFLFSFLFIVFSVAYSPRPLWHVLTDRNRIGGPWYRFFLLFASGATNGISSVMALYAILYTPEFVQAVLLCCIPFSAQAWTVVFIPVERKRDYLSLIFIASVVMFVAGILLSSLSAFLHPNTEGRKASAAWAVLYLVSTIIFGLWCVVQRLYLDSVALKEQGNANGEAIKHNGDADASGNLKWQENSHNAQCEDPRNDALIEEVEGVTASTKSLGKVDPANGVSPQYPKRSVTGVEACVINSEEDPFFSHDKKIDEDYVLSQSEELLLRRQWGKQNIDDNAAKVVLLVVGMVFQLLISFVVFPVDAIPYFGPSTSALDAWHGLRNSMDFIFSSWVHVRHGLLLTMGFAMSFVGCTYLNEQSPTLASVVLQLAGPITSLVIIIIPQWNVFDDSSSIGQKVGGVILLLLATLLYNMWDRQSLRVLREKAGEAKRQSKTTAPDNDEAPLRHSPERDSRTSRVK